MENNKKCAFVSNKKTQDCCTFTFNTECTYEMPVAILTSDIKQFQGVLTFAARLIELENSLSTEYLKDNLFAEYVTKIEGQHTRDLELVKQNGVDELASKISGLVNLISEKERVFSEQTRELHEFQHIPVGQWHRLYNPFDVPCRVVEIQYGEACDEDDIERQE
jgi:hypothetical protein